MARRRWRRRLLGAALAVCAGVAAFVFWLLAEPASLIQVGGAAANGTKYRLTAEFERPGRPPAKESAEAFIGQTVYVGPHARRAVFLDTLAGRWLDRMGWLPAARGWLFPPGQPHAVVTVSTAPDPKTGAMVVCRRPTIPDAWTNFDLGPQAPRVAIRVPEDVPVRNDPRAPADHRWNIALELLPPQP